MPHSKREDYFVDLIERVLGGVQVTTDTEPPSVLSKVDVKRRSWVRGGTLSSEKEDDATNDKPRDPE